MRELTSCQGTISGEHLISKAVIEVLRGDGEFTVSGVHWLAAGDEKSVGINSLVANCLCRDHNSGLSPLDSAAASFISALRDCLESESAPLPYLFSGHDIERWLLKTLKAMAASGNLAKGRVKLPDIFQANIAVIERLDDHLSWPAGSGLYCIMASGSRFVNNTRFQIQPWMNGEGEIVGMWTRIVGLEFVMMLADPKETGTNVGRWLFRPGNIIVAVGGSRRFIELSWDDGRRHDPIKLEFEKRVTN